MNTSVSPKANVGAAFEVVRQTYFNLDKFFNELDEQAGKRDYTSLVLSKPGFLRWKSDTNTLGWLVDDFIKLYRPTAIEASNVESPATSPKIYAVEVDFEKSVGPVVRIIRYEYETGKLIEESVAVSMFWRYYRPMRSMDEFTIVEVGQVGVSSAVPKTDAVKAKYGGLVKASWNTRELMGLTQGSVVDLVTVFDGEW